MRYLVLLGLFLTGCAEPQFRDDVKPPVDYALIPCNKNTCGKTVDWQAQGEIVR